MPGDSDFKGCSCGKAWPSREEFIRDPDVEPIGMTFAELETYRVLYFFNHLACKNTLAVDVEEFEDLISDPIPLQVLVGTDKCKGCCVTMGDLQKCDAECRNAPFRRLFVDRILKREI